MPQGARPWSDLPIDMLFLILSRLRLSDHPYFASVCKQWRSVVSPVYPADLCPLLLTTPAYKVINGQLQYYSPCLNKNFVLDSPVDLSDFRCCDARNGWLMFQKDLDIILVNPLTRVSQKVPSIRYFHHFLLCGHPPHNFKIVGSVYMGTDFIDFAVFTGDNWSFRTHNNISEFVLCDSNPVLHRGSFYWLGKQGNLGVYDLDMQTWNVLSKPDNFGFPVEEEGSCCLVGLEGELFSVLIGSFEKSIRVLRLNEIEMMWVEVKSLGSKVLFADGMLSHLTSASLKSMENKVYLPRIRGEPETIHAELMDSDGRPFFVPKLHASSESAEGTRKADTGSMLCYSLVDNNDRPNHVKFRVCARNIWFDLSMK